jgi:hypothetical protein
VHDQGWKERPVFGKIRYMVYRYAGVVACAAGGDFLLGIMFIYIFIYIYAYSGCAKKFNVNKFIGSIRKLKR